MADVYVTGCLHCGAPTKIFATTGKPAKYCGLPCSIEVNKKKALAKYHAVERPKPVKADRYCLQCKGAFQSNMPQAKYCSLACKEEARRGRPRALRKERGPFSCRQCGIQYMTRESVGDGEMYCSRPCWSRASRLLGISGRKRRHWPASKVGFPVCVTCGVTYARHGAMSKSFCSKSCAKPQPVATTIKACGHCGSPFAGSAGKHYCSSKCSKAHARRLYGRKHRHRARRHGAAYEPIDPIKVFERDRWRCQICQVRTPRSLRGTNEPTAPELDHIMPMALGGSHTLTNVQCACRRCNGEKGARPLGQMLLAA